MPSPKSLLACTVNLYRVHSTPSEGVSKNIDVDVFTVVLVSIEAKLISVMTNVTSSPSKANPGCQLSMNPLFSMITLTSRVEGAEGAPTGCPCMHYNTQAQTPKTIHYILYIYINTIRYIMNM